MSYYALDPRVNIRNKIGYTYNMDDVDRSTVSVTNDWGEYVYIPLLLPGEARTGNLPEMPFVEMNLITSPARALNIGGNVREQDAYIDFNLYYVNNDKITPTVFGTTVANEIIDRITDNRCSVTSCSFVEVINDGREYLEEYEGGKSVIFHKIIEVHVKYYDDER